jgi:hypothetical protein
VVLIDITPRGMVEVHTVLSRRTVCAYAQILSMAEVKAYYSVHSNKQCFQYGPFYLFW